PGRVFALPYLAVDPRPGNDVRLDAQRVVTWRARATFHRAETEELVRARGRQEVVDARASDRIAARELSQHSLHRLDRFRDADRAALVVVIQVKGHAGSLAATSPQRHDCPARSRRPAISFSREHVQISYNAPSAPVLNCKKTCTIGAKGGPPRRAGRRRKVWTTGGRHEDLATSAA